MQSSDWFKSIVLFYKTEGEFLGDVSKNFAGSSMESQFILKIKPIPFLMKSTKLDILNVKLKLFRQYEVKI